MKKYLIVALVALSVITAFGFLIHQNKKLRRERDAYHNNTEVLLSEVERYQTKSGEQAVRVGGIAAAGGGVGAVPRRRCRVNPRHGR